MHRYIPQHKRKLEEISSDANTSTLSSPAPITATTLATTSTGRLQDRFIASRSDNNVDIANWRLFEDSSSHSSRSTSALSTYQTQLSLAMFSQRLSSASFDKIRSPRNYHPAQRTLSSSPSSLSRPLATARTRIESRAILEAPDVVNDFYCTHLDWGKDTYSIALKDEVYTQHSLTQQITPLNVVGYSSQRMILRTAVHQAHFSDQLVVGTSTGCFEIYDMERNRILSVAAPCLHSIDVLQSYQPDIFLVGTRNGTMYVIDNRTSDSSVQKYHDASTGGLCGLTTNSSLIAAGYNNKIAMVFDLRLNRPITRFQGLSAAIKAIQFSPDESHLIATGGGLTDPSVCIWNAHTGIESYHFTPDIHSKSHFRQVSSLHWTGESENELALTIGHELQIWQRGNNDYSMVDYSVKAKKPGERILSASKQRKGNGIAAVSTDEVLQIWSLFNPKSREKVSADSFSQFRIR